MGSKLTEKLMRQVAEEMLSGLLNEFAPKYPKIRDADWEGSLITVSFGLLKDDVDVAVEVTFPDVEGQPGFRVRANAAYKLAEGSIKRREKKEAERLGEEKDLDALHVAVASFSRERLADAICESSGGALTPEDYLIDEKHTHLGKARAYNLFFAFPRIR